jgi:hypothetical protein
MLLLLGVRLIKVTTYGVLSTWLKKTFYGEGSVMDLRAEWSDPSLTFKKM